VNNKQASQVTTGALVALIGLLLLAGQMGDRWEFGRLWPAILIVMGAGRFLARDEEGQRGNGLWLIFIGGIFLMHTFHVLRLHQSWPLFVVAAGIGMIFGRKPPRRRSVEDRRTTP
jgi:hypothetical protein